MLSTLKAVQKQYEAFPYPGYPLWAKPRAEEHFASTSWWTHALLHSFFLRTGAPCTGSELAKDRRFLLGGCGDSQPLVLYDLEHGGTELIAIDFSARSIQRAKNRCLWGKLRTPWKERPEVSWYTSEISEWLAGQKRASLQHMDFFGVLHHHPSPAQVLREVGRTLAPHGTLRLMVYNRDARQWIHLLQKLLRALGLSAESPEAHLLVKRLLRNQSHPYFREILAQIEPTLRSPSRLADMFFQAHELREPLSFWLGELEKNGLKPFALYDRYGELDDLPSPLHLFPETVELESRAREFRFFGNWEIYAYKESNGPFTPFRQKLKPIALPQRWFSGDETSALTFAQKQKIFAAWATFIETGENLRTPLGLTRPIYQRLSREGALLGHDIDVGVLGTSDPDRSRGPKIVWKDIFENDRLNIRQKKFKTLVNAKLNEILNKMQNPTFFPGSK